MWPNFHQDDIMCAAMYPNGLVASSSYDGIVKVWNIDTGHVNFILNAADYGLENVRSVIPADVKHQVSLNNAGTVKTLTAKWQLNLTSLSCS